ncbi:hypothetical protein G6H70_002064 [Listeria monocytogenes]|uniref:hypothetical protein n=1 Tax=Listeria booriae TaxID=1552123 RepID=UPI00139E651D|nr:hypothetical protein [Listeria booriae]EDP7604087.1 hypothetical protein [Listeria monocytogenes]EEO0668554.1 hypothetical protein [Listeria monocytogenes]EEO9123660.1 hypothetical protein [Listeria monocytogenes]MBC6307901.1 hypothetical protein [Listeria booriae]
MDKERLELLIEIAAANATTDVSEMTLDALKQQQESGNSQDLNDILALRDQLFVQRLLYHVLVDIGVTKE